MRGEAERPTEVVIDIETIPAPESYLARLVEQMEFKPHANTKDPDKIKAQHDAWLEKGRWEEARALYQRTSLNPAWGRIVCIGIAELVDPCGTELLKKMLRLDAYRDSAPTADDERRLLFAFWGFMETWDRRHDIIIGHNITGFDLPFILNRSRKWGVQPTVDVSWRRYLKSPIYDTMQEWSWWATGSGSFIKLDELAEVLGVDEELRTRAKGKDVAELWAEGDVDTIVAHCRDDLDVTAQVFARLEWRQPVPKAVSQDKPKRLEGPRDL